jgi:phosphate transport system permease protein
VIDRPYALRRLVDRLATLASALAVLLASIPLVLIVAYVTKHGLARLDPAFFTSLPKPVGEVGGGMGNAIVGTVELVGLASAMGVPVGVLAGVALAEYPGARLTKLVRFSADVLAGVPSIVVGLFVYALIVVRQRHFSAFAGGVALAVIMLPTVTRTTEELLRLVPDSLREAALALGVPKWRTTLSVVLRTAAPGIATGVMLAVARVAGETAPLLFTAFNNRFWSSALGEPVASVPVQVFTFAVSPYDDWRQQAWTGALVLVAIVLALNLAARAVVRQKVRS